jgi:acylphosphatase
MRRLEATIHGYVQGVGYRAFAAREARALGLSGVVRNEADGSVRVVAEGNEESLRQYLRSLARGPSESEVARVDDRWLDGVGEFRAFRIEL